MQPVLFVIAAVLGALFSQGLGAVAELHGRVIRVLDGDTLEIRLGNGGFDQNRRIRFFAIDAPESSMPFGKVCQEQLAGMVAGREVRVRVLDRDRYGRTVGQVFEGTRDINLAMIQAGCAWHYRQFAKKQPRPEWRAYEGAEKSARAAKLRLWSDSNPQKPWIYRRAHSRK